MRQSEGGTCTARSRKVLVGIILILAVTLSILVNVALARCN